MADENDSSKSEIGNTEKVRDADGDGGVGGERTSSTDGDVRRRHNGPSQPGKAAAVSTGEYAQAFRQWMWQYRLWTQAQASLSCSFPMNYFPMGTSYVAPGTVNRSVGRTVGPVPGAQTPENAANQQPPAQGRECQLPALWRRVVAEFFDFFLLFVLKLAASLVVIEYIGFLDLEKYDIDQLLAQDWDSNVALSFTSDLIAMEIINRIFICLFETLCLRRGFNGSVGGTTPGKYLMRLRVISCQNVTQLPGNKVLIIPGNDIGFWNAFLRSVIKNFSLVFFFPVCFTVFFFPNCRTAYDIASGSIVVEVTPENIWAWPRRRN